MTDNEKYSYLLKEIGEMLQNKNIKIMCLQFEIENLKKELAKTEQFLNPKPTEKNIEVR